MTNGKRPFEVVSEALQAWESDNPSRAESLFKQGIQMYERFEPDGLDFALGRYAAFLLEQKRIDDALPVFERAVGRRTDIPAIWSDYLQLATVRRDFDLFRRIAESMAPEAKGGVRAEFLLSYARRADREGAGSFAEMVADWVAKNARHDGDTIGHWAAIGDLGRILERAGRIEDAVTLWRTAFEEGSTDAETANRLSMYFERAKDTPAAIKVIHEALDRGLPANVEETLRKRLQRCEERSAGSLAPEKRRRTEVPAYSVRFGGSNFDGVFQVRLNTPIKDFEITGRAARCLLTSKNVSELVDYDLDSGSEVRRVKGLPMLGDVAFAENGSGLGIHRTAAVGQGPTALRFLSADGSVTAESSVPDATSQIALGPDVWYVGCRNGLLYAFGLDGRQRWTWQTPGARDYQDNAYFRPCPYLVASRRSFAAVASMGNIYAIGPDGRTMWQAVLPNERQTRWEFTVPLGGGRGSQEAFAILGLPSNAPRDDVKSAYRRLALATHPDRNPKDANATAKFREVQGAYEQIVSRPGTAATGNAGITVSFEISGLGPTASFVSANAAGVVVGSSQGRLYRFGKNGQLLEARVLGDGPIRAALRGDGTVGAAWCGDTLVFMKDNQIVNAAESLAWPTGLTMLGEDVALWRGNQLQVMDSYGRLLWSVEFAKRITGVSVREDLIISAAGVLAGFRRRTR